MTEEKCPVCVKLVDVCKEAGEGSFCDKVLKDLFDGKMTSQQFVDELLKNEKVAKALKLKR